MTRVNVKVGQTVTAKLGETTVHGEVTFVASYPEQPIDDFDLKYAPGGTFFIDGTQGWQVTIDPEPLPTEPGLYEFSSYPLAQGYGPYLLGRNEQWYEVSSYDGASLSTNASDIADLATRGTFTPLKPVKEETN